MKPAPHFWAATRSAYSGCRFASSSHVPCRLAPASSNHNLKSVPLVLTGTPLKTEWPKPECGWDGACNTPRIRRQSRTWCNDGQDLRISPTGKSASKAAALPARGMEVSGNSVEWMVRYTAWWCATIRANVGHSARWYRAHHSGGALTKYGACWHPTVSPHRSPPAQALR